MAESSQSNQSNQSNQEPDGPIQVIEGQESPGTEEQPDDGPTLHIYFINNLEHHDWGSNNDAVIVAENETQARQIATREFSHNGGGAEFTMSGKDNFWELEEYASIRLLGTAAEGEYPRMVTFGWAGN